MGKSVLSMKHVVIFQYKMNMSHELKSSFNVIFALLCIRTIEYFFMLKKPI